MKENQEQSTELAVSNSPAQLIQAAVGSGMKPEDLNAYLAAQERWEANQAKKAYNKAMAEFKANPPKIMKDRKVAYKDVRYSHASLANVVDKLTSELSKYGLSASWRTQQNGQIVVTCRITHVQGHSEETSLSAEKDASGSKNAIQAIGSTVTYLQRYTLLSALGLATYSQDDDAAGAGTDPEITEEQLVTLKEYMMSYQVNEARFLKFLGVDSLDQITQSQFKKAIEAIKAKKKGGKK